MSQHYKVTFPSGYSFITRDKYKTNDQYFKPEHWDYVEMEFEKEPPCNPNCWLCECSRLNKEQQNVI